jgi:hypothetical protein
MPFRAFIAQTKADASARLTRMHTLAQIERSMNAIECRLGNLNQSRQAPEEKERKARLHAR